MDVYPLEEAQYVLSVPEFLPPDPVSCRWNVVEGSV